MNRHWKIILSLVAIFGLGGASGAIVTARLRPALASLPVHAVQQPEENWRALTLADYEQRLGLTPEQMEKLKPVFGLTGRKFKTLRANTAERVAVLLREMNQQVAQALDDAQKSQLRIILEDRDRQKPARP